MNDLFNLLEAIVMFIIILFILLKITEAGGNAIRHDYELLLGIRRDDDDDEDNNDDDDEDDDDDDDEDDYDHHDDEDN